MKKHTIYLLIAVITGMLMMLILRFIPRQDPDSISNLQFQDTIHGMTLTPYYNDQEDKYYLFLPSYVSGENVTVSASSKGEVTLSDGNRTYTGTLAEVPLNQDLTLTPPSRREQYTVQVVQCAALPSLFIETQPGAMDYVNADKSHKATVWATMVDENGALTLNQSASLSGRGNGTWYVVPEQAKRAYNLTLSQAASFGSFTDISNLCLLTDFYDESKLRNAIAFHVGQQLEIPYASPFQYTDVYINGEYHGLYGIVTKQEYRKHITTDQIQAIFEIGTDTGKNTFYSDYNGTPINVMYGDPETVRQSINHLDSALYDQDWALCEAFMDLDSMALKYTMDEFLANFDMTYASQYYYLDQNGVIHCMLPWDFDLSLGSSGDFFNNRQETELLGLQKIASLSWYPPLLEYKGFHDRIVTALDQYYTEDFLTNLDNFLYQCVQKIEVSRQCDMLRYADYPLYEAPSLRSGFKDLEEFQRLFSTYFPKRLTFLRSYFADSDLYCHVTFTGNWYGNFCIPKGASLWDYIEGATILDYGSFHSDFLGWYTESGLSPEDIDIVEEDLVFNPVYADATVQSPEQSESGFPAGLDTETAQQPPRIFSRMISGLTSYASFFVILIPLALFSLILLIHEFRNIRRERRRKVHAQSETTLSK